MREPLFPPDSLIRTATARDMSFVLELQQRHSNALGFLPRAALDWYIDAGRLSLVLENGDPAGYIVGRDKLRWNIALRPITQAAIDYSAQRRHHGLRLVARAALDAREAGQMAIQAMCREDLDSNAFWKAAGFEEIGRYAPQTARQKNMICWRLRLTNFTPAWFNIMPPVAGWRARSTRRRQRLATRDG